MPATPHSRQVAVRIEHRVLGVTFLGLLAPSGKRNLLSHFPYGQTNLPPASLPPDFADGVSR